MSVVPTRTIWCCACGQDVSARLTDGREIYPARPDLALKSFWRCPTCGNYIGAHPKSKDHRPLGDIPTPELRNARRHIHAILDPIWKSGRMSRGDVYKALSERLGREYHTAQLRTLEEARDIYRAVQHIARQPQADGK